MQGFIRPLGPIGSVSTVMTGSGMLIAPTVPASQPDATELKTAFRVETYPPSATIYRPGEVSNRVYLLKAGRVRLIRMGRNDERSVVAILKPGDLFGELFRPDEAGIDELAVAAGDVEVWSIDGADFRVQLESRPALALDIIRAYAERTRALRQRVHGLTFKEVPARLADALLSLSEGLGERCPHGGESDLRGVTQQDLADLVGASRSFVSTLINEMKRDGVLGNVGRTLCIRDHKALRRLASVDK